MHVVAPVVEYFPVVQAEQVKATVAAVVADAVPAAQDSHVAAPAREYVPAAQFKHCVTEPWFTAAIAESVRYVPAGQVVQVLWPTAD